MAESTTDGTAFKKRLVKVRNAEWTQLGVQSKLEARPMFAILSTALREYFKAHKARPNRG